MRAKTGVLGVVAAAALSTVSNGAFAGLCPAGGAVRRHWMLTSPWVPPGAR